MIRELAILLGSFAVATVLAELLGADSLGIALTFGQLGFCVALSAILMTT